MGLRVDNKLWLITDTHFGHRNIVKFQQRPETHDIIMLSEWIKRVRPEDQILHLGDVWMGGSPWRWAAIISALPGEKFLIKGNHDRTNDAMYRQAGFEVIKPFIRHGYAFTHRPISTRYPFLGSRLERHPDARDLPDPDWHTNIHGHIHRNKLDPNYVDWRIDPDFPDEGRFWAGKTYINVCVEVTDLAPVQLGNVWKEGTQGERMVVA